MCDDVKYNPKTGLTPAEEAAGAVLSDTAPPGHKEVRNYEGHVVGYTVNLGKYICRTCGDIFEWPVLATSMPRCKSLHGEISPLPDNWIERIFRDEETKDSAT